MFLHNIGCKKYNNVKKLYIENGLEPIIHGNSFHLPHHAFNTADLKNTTSFINNYAEANAILLPGRIPGYKSCDLQLLPTHSTKRSIWESYIKACATMTFRLASYRSFWMKITTPKSYLCWTCQKNSMNITMSANKSETEKLEVIVKLIIVNKSLVQNL